MLNERNTLLEDDGIEEEILVEEECSVAQAVWGDIQGNIENQTDLQNALDAKQDSLTEAQLNAVNSGITSEKVTTYDGYADQIASKADQSALNAESTARGEADTALGTRIDNEALARQQTDNGLQSQIDAITSKSDVVDVVANYAALQAYDTSTLGNNDVVKVLDDETHEDALTYYRWSTTTQTWTYIGQEAPYYSKGQMDVKLAEKQDKLTAGANIQIQNGTISATDTKYTNGNGLNLSGTEFSADTDVLATKEDLEGYYTKPETDNLLAPKLEAEVVAELPTTGTEGKLYLTPKAHTTQTATGNPITATVAEDAGAIESFQLDGDTFQQSYNGSNLINMPIVSGSYNGVTWVVNDDGSITLNGTATANAGIRAEGARIPAVAGETYTLSATGLQSIVNFGYKNSRSGADVLVVTPSSPVKTAQVTAEMLTSANRLDMFFIAGSSFNNQRVTLQLEKGSTASPYEPYTGGQPSPNPSYPQDINVVTGEQTVEIVEKNLFDISKADMMVARLNSSGEITLDITNRLCTRGYIKVKPSTTYTFNALPETSGKTLQAYIVGYSESGSGTAIGNYPTNAWYSFPITFTTGSNCRFIRISYRYSDDSTMATTSATNQQLELGSTASAYAPYTSTDYHISLGDIKLCGLGDDGNGNPLYKDRIYRDGDDWKVHKAVEKLQLVSSQGWAKSSTMTTLDRYFIRDYFPSGTIPSDLSAVVVQSNYFTAISQSASDGGAYGICQLNGRGMMINTVLGAFSNNDAFKNWLDSNSVNAYYALATATDTTITDTNLIAQLEAIRTASLENGTNTITNTATGTNLAGDMEIGYYGYNPRNRYDKWLWLDINNEYEQIGS